MNLRANTLWNLAGIALPLLAALLCIPALMQGFGLPRFGVLSLVWALIGYLGLFELGLGRTMTVKLAPMSAASHERASLVRCGLSLGLLAGCAGAALTALLVPWLLGHWLKVPVDLQADASHAFWLAALGVVPTTGLGVVRGVLEARERFAESNALRMALGVLGFALPWASLHWFGPNLSAAVLALVAARLLCWLLGLWLIRADVRGATGTALSHAGSLLRFGGWLTVSSVVGPLMVYGDRFFLGASASLADVARYAVVQELVQRLLVFPTAFTSAWLPKLAGGKLPRVASLSSGQRKFMLTMLMLCGVGAALLQPALVLWLGAAEAAHYQPMGWVLCVGVLFNALAQWPFTVLHARGNVRATALFHVLQLPLYLLAIALLTQAFGLTGAAFAWVGRALVDWLGLEYLMRRQSSLNISP